MNFRYIFLVFIMTIISACSKIEPRIWKEEVLLSSGEIAVVERITEYESGGDEWAINRSGRKASTHHIIIPFATGSLHTVKWNSRPHSKGYYPEMPLLLEIKRDKLIVIAAGSYETECIFYRRYVFTDNVWKETAIPNDLANEKSNLLYDDGEGYIDLALKKKMNKGAYAKWMKNIDVTLSPCKPAMRKNKT